MLAPATACAPIIIGAMAQAFREGRGSEFGREQGGCSRAGEEKQVTQS
jgi:hypothetical protein